MTTSEWFGIGFDGAPIVVVQPCNVRERKIYGRDIGGNGKSEFR